MQVGVRRVLGFVKMLWCLLACPRRLETYAACERCGKPTRRRYVGRWLCEPCADRAWLDNAW